MLAVDYKRETYQTKLEEKRQMEKQSPELLAVFEEQYGSFDERALYGESLQCLNMALKQEGVESKSVDITQWSLADIKDEVKAARSLLLRQNGVSQALVDGLLLQSLHDERNQLPAWLIR